MTSFRTSALAALGLLLAVVVLLSLAEPAQACSATYKVASGDYCYKIATDNGLSLDQFYALNPGVNCNNLQIGTVVCVRAGSPPNPPPNPPPSPPSGGSNVSYSQFVQALTSNGYPTPSQAQYKAFSSSYQSKGKISSKRELAMFLAEIMWESGGLIYKEEIACKDNGCPGSYRSAGDPNGIYYYGRGYIQLSWSYNYKAASQYLFGDPNVLFYSPQRVSQEEQLSWDTAFWFWSTNVHNDAGVQNGQLGSATNKINGGLECNPCRGACGNRFALYKNVLRAFGLDPNTASNAGC